MRIHDTLALSKRLSPARRTRVAEAQWLGDGAYSRVFALDTYQVLKLTSCQRTAALLSLLAKTPASNYPEGLPAVLESWGTCGQDADGISFQGFVLERLFTPDDIAGQVRARRAGLAVLQRRRAAPKAKYHHSKKELAELEGCLAAARERCLVQERPAAEEHLEMARQLASMRLPCGMERTFAFLAGFIEQTQAELDLFQAGNVLVDMRGYAALADPVAEQVDAYEISSDALGAAMPQYALAAQVIKRIDGISVHTVWDTLAVSDDVEALEAEAANQVSGNNRALAAEVLMLASSQHLQLVHRAPEVHSLWSIPQAKLAAFRCKH